MRLDLVTFGDGDITHVVAEACHPQTMCLIPRGSGPRPGAQPVDDSGVLPETNHRLAADAHSSLDKPELAVTVG